MHLKILILLDQGGSNSKDMVFFAHFTFSQCRNHFFSATVKFSSHYS